MRQPLMGTNRRHNLSDVLPNSTAAHSAVISKSLIFEGQSVILRTDRLELA